MGGAVCKYMDMRHQSSLVPHKVIQHRDEYGTQSVPVAGTETSTSSAIYRNGKYNSDKELQEWGDKFYHGKNLAQQFLALLDKRPNDNLFAYRQIEKTAKEFVQAVNKEMDITYLSERKYVTLGEAKKRIEAFGRGLVQLGVQSQSTVSIYEETRWEWLVSIYGLWSQNIVASTVYANLGEEALFYALHETESKAIICNARSVPNLLAGIKRGAFPPCIIIYLDTLSADCEVPEGVTLMKWTEVLELGREHADIPVNLPTNNDDMALIMYTSGTTGDPKGVMHSHGSLTTGVLIMDQWLKEQYPLDPAVDCYVSYLPMAHILEFGVVSIILQKGVLVGFGGPRSLTDVTARPHGDLTEYKPTLMVGVPRIFDTVRRSVMSKLPPKGTMKRRVFDQAFESRLKALKEGKETPHYNNAVFQKARVALGGNIRLFLSGGGPLSNDTQDFMNVVFGLMVIGWGLTETVCIGTISLWGDIEPGVTGQVLVGEELKLVDTEEYKHTDKPNPRGEICLRGPFLFKGYYKQPELTKEAIDEEGWFHTGDVGTIDKMGRVRLVGRIKALAKNCLGEYIALEILESIYNNHLLVLNNCSCVLVHPEKNYISLLAVTDESRVKKFAEENKIEGKYPDVIQSEQFRNTAAKSFAEMAKQAKRKPFECVRFVHFITEEWTPENGVLTAAMKVRRSIINTKYEKEISGLFAAE